MGKQIQIFTSEVDNDIFRDFLKANYDCQFFQSFSPTKDQCI